MGDRGDCLSHGSLGEAYQELTFNCDSVGYSIVHVFMGGASANSGLLQGHTKWMAR